MKRILLFLMIIGCVAVVRAADGDDPQAHYIANMGAMIEHGDTKVLFDPLFRNNFDIYDLPAAEVESALIAGTAPWDGVDAVFVSHYHEDHFDPAALIRLLRAQPSIILFAPDQAALALRTLIPDPDDAILNRIRSLSLANGEAATDIRLGSLLIEGIRVPHGGWPNRHAHVENIVFRVTLDSQTTVMHFGDADSRDAHYDDSYWRERRSHLAMPPYWFFLSAEGRRILEERMDIGHAIGMHVPSEVADERDERPAEIRDVDLFTRPGETRAIAVDD